MKNKKQNEDYEDLDSNIKALKQMMKNIDPRLSENDIFNSMQGMAPIMLQRQQQINKSSIDKSLDFLVDAKDDIKASIILYDGKIFSRSVYSLQQSVEKACKSLGLALGFVKDQRAIRHISPNVFIKMLEDNISQQFYLPFLEKYTQENQNVKIEKAKKAIQNNKSEFLMINDNSLTQFLSIIESMKPEGQGGQKAKSELNKIQESLDTYFPQYKINVESIVDFLYCITALFILAMVTFPHWESSHYSDTKNIKPKDYTLDMPFVKQLPRMQELTEASIESLERYITYIKTIKIKPHIRSTTKTKS